MKLSHFDLAILYNSELSLKGHRALTHKTRS